MSDECGFLAHTLILRGFDVKQNPLYEKDGFAYFDTHYYGVSRSISGRDPLAIHGVVAKKGRTSVPVCVGEKEDDPVFVITDLLVHLQGSR